MPAFWLGLLILMGFVAYFGTIPIYSDAPASFWRALEMYSVPAAAVGFRCLAFLMRITRSSMLEVLRQYYIRTARSKGADIRVALPTSENDIVSTIDFQAELTAAGAHVTTRWGAVRFFIRRYPLGAADAVIMGLFLFVAAFAPYITVYDPLSTNAAAS